LKRWWEAQIVGQAGRVAKFFISRGKVWKACRGILEARAGDVHEQGAEVVTPSPALGQHLEADGGEDDHQAEDGDRRLVEQRQAVDEPPFPELGHFLGMPVSPPIQQV